MGHTREDGLLPRETATLRPSVIRRLNAFWRPWAINQSTKSEIAIRRSNSFWRALAARSSVGVAVARAQRVHGAAVGRLHVKVGGAAAGDATARLHLDGRDRRIGVVAQSHLLPKARARRRRVARVADALRAMGTSVRSISTGGYIGSIAKAPPAHRTVDGEEDGAVAVDHRELEAAEEWTADAFEAFGLLFRLQPSKWRGEARDGRADGPSLRCPQGWRRQRAAESGGGP